MRRYLIYSEADFEIFRPAGATRCTDGGEIWHGEGDRRSPPPCQISPPSVQRQGCRTPKLKFLLRFDRNVEYKRPEGAYPVRDFHKICRVCTAFQDALGVKIWLDLLEGLWSYGGIKLRGLGSPKFSAPLAAKQRVRPRNVLEVKERARGPLSPCQIWWGLDFTHHWAAKKVEFFVCLSVTITLLNVRVCAPDFAMKAL